MVSKKIRTIIYFTGVQPPAALRDLAFEKGLSLRGLKFYAGEKESCDYVGGLVPPAYEGVPLTAYQDSILEILNSKGYSGPGVNNPTHGDEKNHTGTAQGQNGADSDSGDDDAGDDDDHNSDSADSDGDDNGNADGSDSEKNPSIKKVKKSRKK